MHLLIAIVVAYFVVHAVFSASHYRHYRHRSFLSRCRLSVPGPFHTRISRQL